MNVEAIFFARLKREIGHASLTLHLPDRATVREAAAQIEAGYSVSLKGCMAAVNETYADPAHILKEGDELAFLPPVAGGSGEQDPVDSCQVTAEVLKLSDAEHHLVQPQYGAQTYFVGTVRSPNQGKVVEFIEYEGYAPMAEKVMREAAERARQKHGRLSAFIQHRTGKLRPGEASLIIGVGSPHRRVSLEACDDLIEELKRELPIWKHEGDEDGQHWVDGTAGHETL